MSNSIASQHHVTPFTPYLSTRDAPSRPMQMVGGLWQRKANIANSTAVSIPLSERTARSNCLPGIASIKVEQASSSFFHKVKTYIGFSAKLYALFHIAVKIEGHGYVDRASLSKHVLIHLTGDEKISEKYKNASHIAEKIQYFIKKHHGVRGFEAALAKLDTNQLHHSKNLTKMDLLCTLDHLDPNNLKQIEWSDHIDRDVRKNLVPGDILFFQHAEKNPGLLTTGPIVAGQKLAKCWLKGELEPMSETYTHIAIYIGRGRFAEAVPGKHKEDVRIFRLNEFPNLALKQGQERAFRICRPQNKEMAQLAAWVAKDYAEDKSDMRRKLNSRVKAGKDVNADKYMQTKLKYSKPQAALSLFRSSHFGKQAKRRTLRQVVELSNDVSIPKTESGKTHEFFCSFFIMECVQRGNILQLLPEIAKRTKEPIPRLTGNSKQDLKKIKKWVDKMMKEYPRLLDGLMIQFDPRYVSPQKFRSIVGSNPHLFKDVISIIPPKQHAI